MGVVPAVDRTGHIGGVLGAAVIAFTALWVLGIVLAPALGPYGAVCHRLPERTLSMASSPLAVCARCTGLYVGGLVGLVVAAASRRHHPRMTRRRRILVFLGALAPTAIDGTLATITGVGLSNLPRMLLALPAGAVAGWFLLEALDDLERTIRDDARDLEAS